jgi:hypothetical protein
MSEAKHTPGPWPIEYNNADERSGGQWFEVGPAKVWFPYSARSAIEARAEADANRIADCVYACEGIEDPKNVVPQLLRANERVLELEPLRIQRDELLTALRRAALALAFAAETSPAMQDDYNAVSAAIAKATEASNG